jgi:hypothetical protein
VGISKEQGGFDYLYIDFKMMNKCWWGMLLAGTAPAAAYGTSSSFTLLNLMNTRVLGTWKFGEKNCFTPKLTNIRMSFLRIKTAHININVSGYRLLYLNAILLQYEVPVDESWCCCPVYYSGAQCCGPGSGAFL